MLYYNNFIPFFEDNGNLDEFGIVSIKPANEEEFDEIIAWLEANDMEFEHPYDPRKDDPEDMEEEDVEEWQSLFDSDSDTCIEVMC